MTFAGAVHAIRDKLVELQNAPHKEHAGPVCPICMLTNRMLAHLQDQSDACVDARRKQLIELLSAFSEERWAAGWMRDIDKEAYKEGGVWEILGREVGWPLGYEGDQGWVSWEEAGEHYGLVAG